MNLFLQWSTVSRILGQYIRKNFLYKKQEMKIKDTLYAQVKIQMRRTMFIKFTLSCEMQVNHIALMQEELLYAYMILAVPFN